MGSIERFQTLLGSGQPEAPGLSAAPQVLTPRLCVVAAVIYMIAADNDISDFESSQLQAIVGSDAETLRQAVRYQETHSIEQFLSEAPSLLNKKDRLCLLINVCDSLMSDGVVVQAEQLLFDRMLAAMGYSKAGFQPYFDVLELKNKTDVFGDFDVVANSDALTPPLALVASLIYMMASDGSMAEEEVGRLNASVGCSPALLKAGLRYVSKVRAPQFLAMAAPILNQAQRLCILLNACDAMMVDHVVAKVERDLFRRMLAAFSVSEKEFDKYLNIIFLKNDVPEGPKRSSANVDKPEIPPALGTKKEDGIVFQRKQAWEEETGEAGKRTAVESPDPTAVALGSDHASEMESRLSDTMRQNIDRLSTELDKDNSLQAIEKNARVKKSKEKKSSNTDGTSDLRTVRDETADITSKKNDASLKEPADPRAIRDNDSGIDTTQAGVSSEGPADLRTVRDHDAGADTSQASLTSEGPAKQRAVRDNDTNADTSQAGVTSEGPADLRAVRDNDTDVDKSKVGITNEGPADLRALRDTERDLSNKAVSRSDQTTSDARHRGDSEVVQGAGSPTSQDGRANERGVRDANGDAVSARPAGMSPELGRHVWNSKKLGERRELQDADGLPSNRRLKDERNAFDPIANDSADESIQVHQLNQRMDATRNRTYKIFGYVEAIQSARSIVAASRLPVLPLLPVKPQAPLPAHGMGTNETLGTRATWDDGRRTLLASDEGGPIMSEQQGKAPSSVAEATMNKRLRYTSAVLLPALFLTYGATMVGETAMQHGFIVNENIATDARIVHQMASVQQTVYRIAPESVVLSLDKLPGAIVQAGGMGGSAATVSLATTGTSATANPPGAENKELSDRIAADNFLQNRKQELMAVAQSHQGASAIAAQRQQWFIYAKSIVLLGLGMAFWGVLFRSMRMLHVSTASGLLGLLLTANGYWLFVQF